LFFNVKARAQFRGLSIVCWGEYFEIKRTKWQEAETFGK
jgi:hypothetical protein